MKKASEPKVNPREPPKLRGRRGIATTEVVLAAAMIGMLALLAVPFFQKIRRSTNTSTCISNLRMIAAAKEMYAIEEHRPSGAKISVKKLDKYLKVPFAEMIEPQGGTYEINAVDVDPACSHDDPHILP